MNIVKFENGKYGVRRWSWGKLDWEFASLIGRLDWEITSPIAKWECKRTATDDAIDVYQEFESVEQAQKVLDLAKPIIPDIGKPHDG